MISSTHQNEDRRNKSQDTHHDVSWMAPNGWHENHQGIKQEKYGQENKTDVSYHIYLHLFSSTRSLISDGVNSCGGLGVICQPPAGLRVTFALLLAKANQTGILLPSRST